MESTRVINFDWRVREKHFTDFNNLLKELEFTDSQGRVRKFVGKTFYPKFKELGHTSCQFEECECYKKEKEQNNATKT